MSQKSARHLLAQARPHDVVRLTSDLDGILADSYLAVWIPVLFRLFPHLQLPNRPNMYSQCLPNQP